MLPAAADAAAPVVRRLTTAVGRGWTVASAVVRIPAAFPFAPRPFVPPEESGQGEHGEDGDRERAVLAVTPADRLGERPRLQAAGGAAHPAARPVERRAAGRVFGPGDGEGRPAEGGRADVAGAVGGVAPAAVGILRPDEPGDAAAHERREGAGGAGRGGRAALDQRQRDDRRGRRQRGRRQLAGPVAVRGARGEQPGGQPVERGLPLAVAGRRRYADRHCAADGPLPIARLVAGRLRRVRLHGRRFPSATRVRAHRLRCPRASRA